MTTNGILVGGGIGREAKCLHPLAEMSSTESPILFEIPSSSTLVIWSEFLYETGKRKLEQLILQALLSFQRVCISLAHHFSSTLIKFI